MSLGPHRLQIEKTKTPSTHISVLQLHSSRNCIYHMSFHLCLLDRDLAEDLDPWEIGHSSTNN